MSMMRSLSSIDCRSASSWSCISVASSWVLARGLFIVLPCAMLDGARECCCVRVHIRPGCTVGLFPLSPRPCSIDDPTKTVASHHASAEQSPVASHPPELAARHLPHPTSAAEPWNVDTEHSDDQLAPRYAEPPRMPASINGRAGTSLHICRRVRGHYVLASGHPMLKNKATSASEQESRIARTQATSIGR